MHVYRSSQRTASRLSTRPGLSLRSRLILSALLAVTLAAWVSPAGASPRLRLGAALSHQPVRTVRSHIPLARVLDGKYQINHIYLYQSGSDPVDVTSTLYTSNGQAYVILNGSPIAVTLDYQMGHVYDLSHDVIGFIYLG